MINIGNLKSSIKSLKETKNESDEPQFINIRDTVYVFMTLELSNFSGESQILVEATADGIEKHYYSNSCSESG